MKAPIVEDRLTERQGDTTGTARRYPKVIGERAPGYSLDEFIERSEQMTDVLKHFLTFPLSEPKKTR